MKKLLIPALFLLAYTASYAQITSVNSACSGTPVNFTAPANEISYTWTTDTVNIDQTRGTFTSTGLTGFTLGTFASTNYDNGTWYTFINFHGNNTMRRLTYTGDPNGAYTVSTVGVYGNASRLEGIDIVKDPVTGNWFGITGNGSNLYVLSFGNSLANAPTSLTYTFSTSLLSWPHQIGVAKYGSNWIGFVGDRNSTIKRIDFGNALTNTPTITTIPNVGSVNQPCNFAIHKEGGNWYMLVANLISATVTRYNFGTNISNNNPTGTALGNISNLFSLPRSICIVKDCDQVIAYVLNQGNGLIKLNFGSSITNTPTGAATGSTGIGSQNSLNTYIVDTALYANIVSFGSVSLSRGKLLSFPPFDTTKYYDNSLTHTFSTPGTKNMTLFVNLASHMGSEAFCKNISIGGTKIFQDTVFCANNNDSLYIDASASLATGYLWNTSATTPGIYVKSSGKYWVTFSGPACLPSDTINVTFSPKPSVSLGVDTAFCDTLQVLGNKLTNPTGATFLWNTLSTNATIPAKTTGSYWLEVTDGACKDRDTIAITVSNTADVFLGNDTSICNDDTLTLTNKSGSPTGAVLLWSDNSTGPSIDVTNGTFWLSVTHNGCVGSDTINVTQDLSPVVDLGADTAFCNTTQTLANKLPNPPGSTYLWSTFNTNPTISANTTGKYWLEVTNGSCKDRDTIAITVTDLPSVYLGNDTAICDDEFAVLSNKLGSPTGAAHLWSDGSTGLGIQGKSGTYWLTVTHNGCVASDTINVTQNESPVVMLGNDTFLCPGQDIVLRSNTQPSGNTYRWNSGSTDSTIKATGGYYTLTVTSPTGCEATDDITIREYKSPSITLGDDQDLCSDQVVRLPKQIEANSPYSIQWQDGTIDSIFIAKKTGRYTATLIDKCGTASAVVDITFTPCHLFFPSAFSPNGDNINDIARIRGDLSGIQNYELSIYNRWGQRVYNTTNPNEGWNGLLKGEKSKIDTYFYMIQFNYRGEQQLMKGDLTLVR